WMWNAPAALSALGGGAEPAFGTGASAAFAGCGFGDANTGRTRTTSISAGTDGRGAAGCGAGAAMTDGAGAASAAVAATAGAGRRAFLSVALSRAALRWARMAALRRAAVLPPNTAATTCLPSRRTEATRLKPDARM